MLTYLELPALTSRSVTRDEVKLELPSDFGCDHVAFSPPVLDHFVQGREVRKMLARFVISSVAVDVNVSDVQQHSAVFVRQSSIVKDR